MFKENKYTKYYFAIIEDAKRNPPDGYSEKHHIIPTSIDPSKKKERENIVRLSARQHFICHLLLTKMCSGSHLVKMQFAFARMLVPSKKQARIIPNSHTYAYGRKQFAAAQSIAQKEKHKADPERMRKLSMMVDRTNPEYRERLSKAAKSRKVTWGDKSSATLRRKYASGELVVSQVTREKLSKALSGEKNHMFGKRLSAERKAKFSRLGWKHSASTTKRMSDSRRSCPLSMRPMLYFTIQSPSGETFLTNRINLFVTEFGLPQNFRYCTSKDVYSPTRGKFLGWRVQRHRGELNLNGKHWVSLPDSCPSNIEKFLVSEPREETSGTQ